VSNIDIPQVSPVSTSHDAALLDKINDKTKPLGSLGKLEALAHQLGRVQGTLSPSVMKPRVVVFAGDHGIVAEGVSAFPQEVTWQMVMNFIGGGAAVNSLAREFNVDVEVVDAGVNRDFAGLPGLVHAKIAHGTRNSAVEPAMTPQQLQVAFRSGSDAVTRAAENGCNVIAFGEMGIGNTSAASLLLHKIAGVPLDVAVGRGTGVTDDGLEKKRAVLQRASARTGAGTLPADVALLEYGGFEIAMIAAAVIAAAARNLIVVVDGFIATSAVLVASRMCPPVLERCVFAHQSAEAGHAAMLSACGASALLSLDMRLGEGTGAVLAVPLLRAACAFMSTMASFASAGVAERA
jgi:nicotinate-nucleotide--dimethylbenzimidazole phosphoribosyltransferase